MVNFLSTYNYTVVSVCDFPYYLESTVNACMIRGSSQELPMYNLILGCHTRYLNYNNYRTEFFYWSSGRHGWTSLATVICQEKHMYGTSWKWCTVTRFAGAEQSCSQGRLGTQMGRRGWDELRNELTCWNWNHHLTDNQPDFCVTWGLSSHALMTLGWDRGWVAGFRRKAYTSRAADAQQKLAPHCKAITLN